MEAKTENQMACETCEQAVSLILHAHKPDIPGTGPEVSATMVLGTIGALYRAILSDESNRLATPEVAVMAVHAMIRHATDGLGQQLLDIARSTEGKLN